MKKILSYVLLASLCLALLAGCGAEKAEETGVPVYVTISDAGEIVLAAQKVFVPDEDGDGIVNIDDTLRATHEAAYKGGAAEGYASEETEYGISMTKLWGVENGGSYGYMLNNASPSSLLDDVKAGDYVAAYSYEDLVTWMDVYYFFNACALEAKKGEEITLTLSCAGFDADWNPVTAPFPGAPVTVDGEEVGILSGEDGTFTLSFDKPGTYVVSAEPEDFPVKPVCVVTVG